ncbi:hypothetical protein AMAG_12993 [Allomyces macrogynus ATCC 38327]|uniref:Uncharacterized protein n=1 Tax=Allomyces macrogynus (strain ATCC 38327) TaxID=578462 RepID=A0A0L0T0L9_ALLM3|nr:hypothetical protein AMAG_12993 [Allomyces macrogynus ATCC 38327]|eukprot:KNE68333.1 hypothetical protein AMAG_12993 [Allomyces macrogynus ATCC 38327]
MSERNPTDVKNAQDEESKVSNENHSENGVSSNQGSQIEEGNKDTVSDGPVEEETEGKGQAWDEDAEKDARGRKGAEGGAQVQHVNEAPMLRKNAVDQGVKGSGPTGHHDVETSVGAVMVSQGRRDSMLSLEAVPSAKQARVQNVDACALDIHTKLVNVESVLSALVSTLVKSHKGKTVFRAQFVQETKNTLRGILDNVLEHEEDVDMALAKDKVTDAWRTKQARALVTSSSLKAACKAVEGVWLDLVQAAESKGINKEKLPSRVNVAMETVESVQVMLRDFGGEVSPTLTPRHVEGLKTDDVVATVVANLVGLLKGARKMEDSDKEDLGKMEMALEVIAKSIVGVLAKFGIDLAPRNITNLVCNIALPLLDSYLMVKAMNVDWTLEFPVAGTLYDPSTMTDDDNELEWRLNDDDEVTALSQGMRDTKVVLLATVPGIPHRFGGAETVVHRARVLTVSVRHKVESHHADQTMGLAPASIEVVDASPPAQSGETMDFRPSMYWKLCKSLQLVLERLMKSVVATRKGFSTNEHELNGCPWEARKAASDILLKRMIHWSSRKIGTIEALQELESSKSKIAVLENANKLQHVDQHVDLILLEHEDEVQRELETLSRKYLRYHASPCWKTQYVHNLLEWNWLFLAARRQGYGMVFPREGSAAYGVFKCVDHPNCRGNVKMAIFPNLISQGSKVVAGEPCIGYCTYAFAAHESQDQPI